MFEAKMKQKETEIVRCAAWKRESSRERERGREGEGEGERESREDDWMSG